MFDRRGRAFLQREADAHLTSCLYRSYGLSSIFFPLQFDLPKTMETAVFALFPSLPAELRIQIWRDALPDKFRQALYFYKKGCWQPQRLTEADANYNPHNDELNLVFDFHHELLDDAQLVLPYFFVNHEAHGVTLAWIHSQGIKIQFSKERQCLTFTRSFNPKYDVLYIPLEKWDEFFIEPFDRLEGPDLFNRIIDCPGSQITRIAVPQVLLQHKVNLLADLFEWYNQLDMLFIIINTPPDLHPEENNMGIQQQWELESIQGATFSWDHDHNTFVGGCDDINNQELYKLIQGASNGLGEKLVDNNKHSFEVHPGFAVRK